MKRLLDADGNTATVFHHDDMTGETVLEHVQDVTPVIEANKVLATMNDGYSPSRELRRVASVPKVMLEVWCQEDGIPIIDFMQHPKHYRTWLRKKLYDSDNRHILTAPHKK